MSREKQIEEMAEVIKTTCSKRAQEFEMECPAFLPCSKCTAELLYRAGYRKQSEGEWVMSEWGDDAACSECGCDPYDFKEPLHNPEFAQYCPGCGAKMRGVNFGELKTWDEIRREKEMVG